MSLLKNRSACEVSRAASPATQSTLSSRCRENLILSLQIDGSVDTPILQ